MGAGAIPLDIEKAFRDRQKSTHTLLVYTADEGYRGIDVIDVSFNGGNAAFTPPRHLLFDYKMGRLTAEQFQQEYFKFLETSFVEFKYNWDNMLDSEKIVLICSCNADDASCHRQVIIKFLEKFGAEFKGKLKS